MVVSCSDRLSYAVEDDWDGYHAKAVSQSSIAKCEVLLPLLKKFGLSIDIGVVPSGDASVILRSAKNKKHFIHMVLAEDHVHYAYRTIDGEGSNSIENKEILPQPIKEVIEKL